MRLKRLLLAFASLIVLLGPIECGGGDDDCMPIDEILGSCQGGQS